MSQPVATSLPLPARIELLCQDLARCRRYGYKNRMVKMYLATLEQELETEISYYFESRLELNAAHLVAFRQRIDQHIADLAEGLEQGVFDHPMPQ